MTTESQPMSVTLKEIQARPELLVRLFSEGDQTSFHVRKNGDQITIFSGKTYPQSVRNIVERAKVRHEKNKKSGICRDKAFAEFEEIQEKIQHYLK